jgi:hypothetical protein
MFRRTLAFLAYIFGLLALHAQDVQRPNFSAVSPYLARIDAGKDPNLRLEMKADGFSVKVMSESPLTTAAKQQLMQHGRQKKESECSLHADRNEV